MTGDRANLTAEAADVLYHLLVVLQGARIPLSDVMKELERRTGAVGIGRKGRAQGRDVREGASHGPGKHGLDRER